MTITDYSRHLEFKRCKFCMRGMDNKRKKNCALKDEPIQYYEHDGGYKVDGMACRQWLYVECPACKYQWGLRKLGVPEMTVEDYRQLKMSEIHLEETN